MTGMKKAVTVLLQAAAITGLSWWLQSGLTLDDAAPFLRALRWALLIGALLLGLGITRRRQSGALFHTLAGGITLAWAIVLFVLYGGMENMTAAGTDTALSLLSCLWTALTVACSVRAIIVCCLYRAEEPSARNRILCYVAVILLAVVLVLVFSGVMLRFFHADTAAGTRQDIATALLP